MNCSVSRNMKKLFIILLLCAPLAAQTCTPSASQTCTPNISLALPVHNSQSWDTAVNSNFSRLDVLLSGLTTTTGTNPCVLSGVAYVGSGESVCWGSSDIGAQINAALASFPSCTDSNGSYPHCGTVDILQGNFSTSTAVTMNAHQRIEGQGQAITHINYTGNSCWITATSSPQINAGWGDAGGVFKLDIDGTGGSPGACGIHWHDIIGFEVNDVSTHDFTGIGSIGLWEDAITQFTERSRVLAWTWNNTIGFQFSSGTSVNGGQTTLGYGNYDIWANCNANQTCLLQKNFGSDIPEVQFSDIHVIINGSGSGSTGISIQSGQWSYNNYNIHMEGVATGWNLAAGVGVHGVGSIEQSNTVSTNTFGVNANVQGISTLFSSGSGFDRVITGSLYDCASTAAFTETCSPSGQWPLAVDIGGAHIFAIDAAGNFKFGSSLSTTVNPPTVNGSLGISLNGTSTSSYQSKRGVAGCTTTASVGGVCASPITVTWPTAFADTNYSVSCTGMTPTNVPSAPYLSAKAAGSVTVNYFAITAAAASWATVDCIAVHD